jgi:predicted solute-binding protein
VAEKRGRLVDVDAFGEWWETEVATPIRRGIENLQRQHGPAAAEIIVKALAKAETAVGKRIDHDTPTTAER